MSSNTSSQNHFWPSFILDLFKFLAEAGIAIGIFYYGNQLSQIEARPRLEQIGTVSQFSGDDNYMTVRLKNFSTRQDAVITGIEYIVTDAPFLECIKKRRPFDPGAPPGLSVQQIQHDNKDIQLTTCDWRRDGQSFRFEQQLDLAISPGKADSLRLCIGKPSWNKEEWKSAWFTGTLVIWYDKDRIVIPDVNLFQRDLKGIGSIPPKW